MSESISRLKDNDSIINTIGTVTRLGGSRLSSTAREYMACHSAQFVDMAGLEREVSAYAADVFGVEAACVTSGAVAGLAISAAACMNRGAPSGVRQLPDTTGLPSEVLVLKSHRILYDVGVRLSGARFREIGVTSEVLPEEIAAAVSDRSAMFLYVDECRDLRGSLPLEDVVGVLAGSGIPVVVDAAAEMPPFTRPADLLNKGADAVVISGGKELRGPQASGLVLGRLQIIEWSRQNNFPEYSIGRAMKFDRETLFGLLGALKDVTTRDVDTDNRWWLETADELLSALLDVPGIICEQGYPQGPGVQPTNIPRVFVRPTKISAEQLAKRLLKGEQKVYTKIDAGRIAINVQTLERGELKVLVQAVKEAVTEI